MGEYIMLLRFLERAIEQRIPRWLQDDAQQALDFAGEDVSSKPWLARNILLTILLSALYSTAPFFFPGLFTTAFKPYITPANLHVVSLAIAIVSLIVFASIAYFSLYYRIDARRIKTQEALPQFLSSVATNLEAGIEPLSALYVSLRPEYAPITDELKKVRSLSLGPTSIIDQLSLIKGRIDSLSLRMTVAMVERASRGGGNLTKLLTGISRDIREMNELHKELITTTRGYIYLILFLVVVGVPLLLSVSTIFVKAVSAPTGGSLGSTDFLGFSLFGISKDLKPIGNSIDIVFALLLAVGAINASLTLGVLQRGETKAGVKYIPLLLPLSVAAYFILGIVINKALVIFGVM